MRRLFVKLWRPANAVLIVLLIAAQTGAIAHAYEHDPGTLQDATCASCVTVNQLSAACVDSGFRHDVEPAGVDHDSATYTPGESIRPLTHRQRGPPKFTLIFS